MGKGQPYCAYLLRSRTRRFDYLSRPHKVRNRIAIIKQEPIIDTMQIDCQKNTNSRAQEHNKQRSQFKWLPQNIQRKLREKLAYKVEMFLIHAISQITTGIMLRPKLGGKPNNDPGINYSLEMTNRILCKSL